MSRLFCAVNKNLASICSDADQPFNAIGYLLNVRHNFLYCLIVILQSLTIERSSVSIWHQLGLECVKANHLGLANFAFRQVRATRCTVFSEIGAPAEIVAPPYIFNVFYAMQKILHHYFFCSS